MTRTVLTSFLCAVFASAMKPAQQALLLMGFGLVLGIRHSTDADHIVALSTIVSKQRSISRSALIGGLWGVGHSVTVFAVGILILLFHVRIPVRLGLLMEFSVAVMLVVLGVLNLTGVLPYLSRIFVRNDSYNKVPRGTARPLLRPLEAGIKRLGLFHTLRPLVIGLVHGLAGSAAIALLVLATIRDPLWATAYLAIFGFGTMLGMMLMTTLVAIPLRYGQNRFKRLSESLGWFSGLISVCFGALLMYHLGIVDGLFTAHPRWTPQ